MLFAPFLAFYAILFFLLLAGIFVMLEIGVINYAFGALGLPPQLAFMALFASLIGSYINIPIAHIDSGVPHPAYVVSSFRVRDRLRQWRIGDAHRRGCRQSGQVARAWRSGRVHRWRRYIRWGVSDRNCRRPAGMKRRDLCTQYLVSACRK